MGTIKLTEEQIEEAQQALLVLTRLFGEPVNVGEISLPAGDLIQARVYASNNQGNKYVVHAANDDVCAIGGGNRPPTSEELQNCTCGLKTGTIAEEWVKAGFVCRVPSSVYIGTPREVV